MNEYITLDGYNYRTSFRSWRPNILTMTNARVLANGTLDAIYGPTTLYLFTGEIVADVTPETGYGSITNLRATLAKKQKFTFVDHYGTTYSVVAIGPYPERTLSPKWDSPSNTFYVTVQLKGITT